MDNVTAGRLGGNKTACEYGLNRYICPEFGGLCPRKLEEKSEFYSKNGAAGGVIGARVLKLRDGKNHSKRQSERGKLGGRGNTREKRLKGEGNGLS